MNAPTTTDAAARAEHKRLFDAQVQERMSGVKEKSQFLSQADTYYHPNLPANLGLSGAQVARPRRQDPMLAMPTAGPKSTRSSCWVSSRCSSSRIRRPLARKQLEATHRVDHGSSVCLTTGLSL